MACEAGVRWTNQKARQFLRSLFDVAVASADVREGTLRCLPAKPRGRCIVVGAGKASAAMAAAIEAAWPDVDMSGTIVTKYGHSVPAGRIRVLEAAHPIPDNASQAAAVEIMQQVRGLSADDLVIAVISGGGSSLMALPPEGMTLAEKSELHRALVSSGATIAEMNAVRSRLSGVKGGKLAAACRPARVVTLVVSDIPGDDLSLVASGPTIGSAATTDTVDRILNRYGLILPAAARLWLSSTPEAHDKHETDIRLVASPWNALARAASEAQAWGIKSLVFGDFVEGESKEVAKAFGAFARSCRTHHAPIAAPAVLISGGETSVSIGSTNGGRGGRNTEFALSLAIALRGERDVWAIAADTDGIDGTENAAGALVAPDTLDRCRAGNLDPEEYLRAHDSFSLFDALGDLVRTGPTLTNVNDFRAILIGK